MEAGPVTRDTWCGHKAGTWHPPSRWLYIVRLKRPTWSCENIRKKKTISCKSRHYPHPLDICPPWLCVASLLSPLRRSLRANWRLAALCSVKFSVCNAAMSERFNMKSCQNNDTRRRRTTQLCPGTAQLCSVSQACYLLIILFVGLQHAELFNSSPGLGQFWSLNFRYLNL